MAKVNNPVPMPDADKEDALLVAVMRDGKIYFSSDMVTPTQLTQKVKDRLAQSGGQARLHQVRRPRQIWQRGRRGGQRAFGRGR